MCKAIAKTDENLLLMPLKFMYFCSMQSLLLTLGIWMIGSICMGQSQIMSPTEFEKALQKGKVQLLDVRTIGEYNQAHIDSALQADWTNSAEFADRVKYLDRSKPVYVYCQGGMRSRQAAAFLSSQMGFKVYDLEGGLSQWMAQGKPVVQTQKVKQLSKDSLMAQLSAKGLSLVDFNAKWCAPCVRMKPSMDSLSMHYQALCKVVMVDGAVQTDLLKTMQVAGFPTLIIFKNGQEVWRQQGYMEFKDLLSKLQSFQ